MTRRILLILGLVLFAFDVARLNITGVALAGIVLMGVALYLYGILSAAFWVADEELSERLDRVDQEVGR